MKTPRSIIRRLFNPNAKNPAKELDRVALLVCESHMQHLVFDPTLAEIEALIRARARVVKADAVILADVLSDPAAALAPYDGGKAMRRQTLEWARSQPVELS